MKLEVKIDGVSYEAEGLFAVHCFENILKEADLIEEDDSLSLASDGDLEHSDIFN
tara:strand:- start:1762 stop:1926 length:165 start_codon:yes stop_codon:yes gene_type:complete